MCRVRPFCVGADPRGVSMLREAVPLRAVVPLCGVFFAETLRAVALGGFPLRRHVGEMSSGMACPRAL